MAKLNSLLAEIVKLRRQNELLYSKEEVVNIATKACMSAVHTVLTDSGLLLSDVAWNDLNPSFKDDIHNQVKAVVKAML
jgi:hypothetical protein